jgi:hypothetical protein
VPHHGPKPLCESWLAGDCKFNHSCRYTHNQKG